MNALVLTGGIILGVFLFGILGATRGGAAGMLSGMFVGSAVGALVAYLLWAVAGLRSRVRQLEQRLPLSPSEPATPMATTPPAEADHAPALATPPSVSVSEVEIPAPPEAVSEPPPVTPSAPAQTPSAFWSMVRRTLLGGNTVVTVGAVVLFFGVAFLLKFAVERELLSPEIRLIGATLGALSMLVIGWRLRLRRQAYALVLQGGGIGILYVTVFAALKLYSLLPAGASLVLLIAIVTFAALLAILQDARTLAIVGVVGGFLAPILTATGSGNHVMLFSYYALLNAGILGIAWFKSWRLLNSIGFVATFVIGGYWGASYYTPGHFQTTEPFLLLFFLFYVAIAVIYAHRQAPQLKGYIDGMIVFGTPLFAFALQAAMVRSYDHGLSISALTLGAFYLALAWGLALRQRETLRLLVESFLAIGVVFVTLAIPLELDARVTAAFWALEGTAIVWIGFRQDRRLAKLFGAGLQFGAGLFFIKGLQFSHPLEALPVLNGLYLGYFIISVAGLVSAYFFNRRSKADSSWHALGNVLFVWAVLWWIGGALNEIDGFVPTHYQHAALLGTAIFSAGLFELVGSRLRWPLLRYPALGLLPVMFIVALLGIDSSHPSANGGYLAWPLAFVWHYWLLHRHDALKAQVIIKAWHAAALWLLAILGAWELSWWVGEFVQGAGTWPRVAWVVIPVALIIATSARVQTATWPFTAHRHSYLVAGMAPLVVLIGLWSLVMSLSNRGDPWPLIYLPLLNPMDLAQGFVVLAWIKWIQVLRQSDRKGSRTTILRLLAAALAFLVFVWLNAILIRTFHHWAGIPFNFRAMYEAVTVQAALSIFWSLIALTTMVIASRKRLRVIWFTGGGLLGLVVIKLFVVDLANSGTVARIISFIAVGILLLIIGYFTPVPPRENSREVTSEQS